MTFSPLRMVASHHLIYLDNLLYWQYPWWNSGHNLVWETSPNHTLSSQFVGRFNVLWVQCFIFRLSSLSDSRKASSFRHLKSNFNIFFLIACAFKEHLAKVNHSFVSFGSNATFLDTQISMYQSLTCGSKTNLYIRSIFWLRRSPERIGFNFADQQPVEGL